MKKQLLYISMSLLVQFCWAQTSVFNGGSGTDFLYSNTANWSTGSLPGDASGYGQFNATANLDVSATLRQIRSGGSGGLSNGEGIMTVTGQAFPVAILQSGGTGATFNVNSKVVLNGFDDVESFQVNGADGILTFGPSSDLTLNSNARLVAAGTKIINMNGILRGSGLLQIASSANVVFGETSDNSNFLGDFIYFGNGASVIANTADDEVFVPSGKKIQLNANNGTVVLNGSNIYQGILTVGGTNSFRMEVNKNQPNMQALNINLGALTVVIGSDVSLISFSEGNWTTGTLVVENFKNGVLKFGTTSDALDAGQLSQIDIGGGAVSLDDNGYLIATSSPVYSFSAWSENPTSSDNAVIDGNYAAGSLDVNDLLVQEGSIVTIASGETLKVSGDLINRGTLNIASGGSLVTLGNAVGNASISRNTAGSDGYSIVGSPVAGATLDNLASQGANLVYDYDGSNYIAVSTGAMMSGKGYFVAMVGNTNPSATFAGSIVSGDIAANVSGQGDGFTILANPYAAPITAADIISSDVTNQATTGSIYIWDDGGSNDGSLRAGTYRVANNTTSDFTTIGSVQGFYVQSNNGGDITFTPAMQDATTGANVDANYYRKRSNQIIKLSISGNDLYHETVIGLTPEATNERDYGLDAQYLKGNDLMSFYTTKDDVKFATLGLPFVDAEPTEISLGMDLAEAGIYTLSIDKFSGFADDQAVTLIDQVTGSEYDLTADFAINIFTDPVVESKRFKIVVAPSKVLSIDDLNTGIQVFGNESSLVVNYKSENVENVSIMALDGKIIFNENVSFSRNQAEISTVINRNTIYILRVNKKSIKFLIK